jgi:PAS domain S-box-containing protein
LNRFGHPQDPKTEEAHISPQTDLWLPTVLRSIGDAVIACNASGNIVFMNPVAESLTGWPQAEALDCPLKDIFRIVHEETRVIVESPVDKVRRLGVTVGLANHTLLLRRDGTEVSIDDSGAPIHDAEGRLTGIVLIFRDVTARRRAERNLELLSESGRALAQSLDFQATLENIARLCIRSFADFCYFDLAREDGSIERTVRLHRDPSQQPLLDEASQIPLPRTAQHPVIRSLALSQPTLIEHVTDDWLQSIELDSTHLRCIRALRFHTLLTVPVSEGERSFGTLSFCRTLNPSAFDQEDCLVAQELAHRVAAVLVHALLYRDAQVAREEARLEREKLQAQKEHLERQTSELEAVYRTAPIGLALFDPVEFRYLRLNDRQAEIVGLPPSDILGKTLTEIAPIDGLNEMFQQVADGQPIRNALIEGELPAQPGVHRYWNVNYFPVHGEDGKVQAITAASLEITGQKRAEKALIQNEKIAAVGRLASSIAHEINNPLEAVTNLLYLARHSTDHADIQQHLAVADLELRRISLIASQTLRFYRQSSRPNCVQVERLISTVLSLYQGRLQNSGIQVETRPWVERPILCFEGEVRQVLNNLLGNALDAMPHGGRLLIRSRETTDWKTGHKGLTLSFADTGSGIPRDVQKNIFEPFFTTKGLMGTGLGLWITKGIVEKHHGTLRVRSSLSTGATGTVFRLCLPFDPILPAIPPPAA